MAAPANSMSTAEIIKKYCEFVINGKIPACKYAQLACKRHLNDLERSKKERDYPFYFDEAAADRICRFVGALPHVKGKLAGQPIKLEPWQRFVLGVPFGWKRKKDDQRRFREAYIEVPRKNAKSTISSGVALYMLGWDGEGGAEVYAAATNEKQARIVFDDAANMVRKVPGLKKIIGVHQDNLHILASASKFEPCAANAATLDGLNPHCVILDEVHAHRTRALYDVMKSAMGARSQPMLWQITTAGFNLAGVGYEQHQYLRKILEGTHEDDSFFGILYSIDEGDDWTDPEVWRKANPNFGVSVYPDYLDSFCTKAKDTPSNLTNFLTKHLCKWVNADVSWMNMEFWHRAEQKIYKIEDFLGEPCWVGMDLASRDDVASVYTIFKRDGVYYGFGKHYLPEMVVDERAHSTHAHYAKWAYTGQFTLTDGETTDYGHIRDDILELASKYDVRAIGYDRYNATQLVSELIAEGLQMVEIPQSARELSDPMKHTFVLIKERKLLHDGNEAMTWMVSNVACHEDRNENIFPVKSSKHLKIDGAVAMIMAVKRAILHDQNEVSVYMTEERPEGFLVF